MPIVSPVPSTPHYQVLAINSNPDPQDNLLGDLASACASGEMENSEVELWSVTGSFGMFLDGHADSETSTAMRFRLAVKQV